MLLHIGNKEQIYIICTFAAIFLDEEQYNIEYKNCYIKKKYNQKNQKRKSMLDGVHQAGCRRDLVLMIVLVILFVQYFSDIYTSNPEQKG